MHLELRRKARTPESALLFYSRAVQQRSRTLSEFRYNTAHSLSTTRRASGSFGARIVGAGTDHHPQRRFGMRPRTIDEFLRKARIPFTAFQHPEAFTAQHGAALSHVSGRSWAKTVVCLADDEPILAVLPANLRVNL